MATRKWTTTHIKNEPNILITTVVLDHGDVSEELALPGWQDKTAHIYGGTFGDSTVSIKGSNVSGGTFLDIHRTNDSSTTYTGVAAALLGHLLENPVFLKASADGTTGTGLTVIIIHATPAF